MQKYLITLGCVSDSLNRSTSLSAKLKHSGRILLTATSRPSNLPLKQREWRGTAIKSHWQCSSYSIKESSLKEAPHILFSKTNCCLFLHLPLFSNMKDWHQILKIVSTWLSGRSYLDWFKLNGWIVGEIVFGGAKGKWKKGSGHLLQSCAKWLRHSSQISYNLCFFPHCQWNCIESYWSPPLPLFRAEYVRLSNRFCGHNIIEMGGGVRENKDVQDRKILFNKHSVSTGFA